MSSNVLLLDPLRRSLAVLADAVSCHEEAEASTSKSSKMAVHLRTAVIKDFEIAYEVSWKLVARWIASAQGESILAEQRTRRDLFRLAARLGLIADATKWFAYHQARNLGAHIYQEKIAEESYSVARRFLESGEKLLAQLEKNNAS